MIDLEPPSKFYHGIVVPIFLIIWGSICFLGVNASQLKKIVLLFPLTVFSLGIYTLFGTRKLLFNEVKNEILLIELCFNYTIHRKSYPKSDFDSIVVDKTNNDGDVYGFMIFLNGKSRVKLGYVSTKENVLTHAKYLKTILDLPIEDW